MSQKGELGAQQTAPLAVPLARQVPSARHRSQSGSDHFVGGRWCVFTVSDSAMFQGLSTKGQVEPASSALCGALYHPLQHHVDSLEWPSAAEPDVQCRGARLTAPAPAAALSVPLPTHLAPAPATDTRPRNPRGQSKSYKGCRPA